MDNIINNWGLWNSLTFKTQGYRKNFDFTFNNDAYITEYAGEISKLRIIDRKLPYQIGDYEFSVWNLGVADKFNVNLGKLLKYYSTDMSYNELYHAAKNKVINLNKFKKLVIVHSLIIHRDYRKRGVTEEFVEMLYRDFHSKDTAIIFHVKPFQSNKIEYDHIYNDKYVRHKENLDDDEISTISSEYYSLDEFLDKKDSDKNSYKLFALANRCGFDRIGETNLFIFIPKKIEKYMTKKYNFIEELDSEDEDDNEIHNN